MGQALRIDQIPDYTPPPAELTRVPNFEPTGLTAAEAEELRQRSRTVRRHAIQQQKWADTVEALAAKIVARASLDTLWQTERLAIQFAQMANDANDHYAKDLDRHERMRRFAELMPPTERAAWLGFLEPYIAVLNQLINVPKRARERVFQKIRDVAPGYYPDSLDETKPDLLLNDRAAMAYCVALRDETGLRCEKAFEILHGDVVPVVKVIVPPEAARPHRAYADAEERAHEKIERGFPEIAGRVVIRYVKSADEA